MAKVLEFVQCIWEFLIFKYKACSRGIPVYIHSADYALTNNKKRVMGYRGWTCGIIVTERS